MTSPTLTYTSEIRPSFSSFPSGYGDLSLTQSFDFGRNWSYHAIQDGTNGGIAVTDLTTMTVIKAANLAEMYAGTSYGVPPGFSPDPLLIGEITCGFNTDFYMLMSPRDSATYKRLTRVDPDTMKVTGEFFVSNSFPPPITCVTGNIGLVNTTTTHMIVAYIPYGPSGAQIFDGTGMAVIGIGPTPTYTNGYFLISGIKAGDGSCEFLMIDPDGTSNIDIWRINITDGLVMTSTKTGTAHLPATPNPTQANYDVRNDAIILMLAPSGASSPINVVSVNYDGSINWNTGPFNTISGASRGQTLLNYTTLMVGSNSNFSLIDTGMGEVVYSGAVPIAGEASSFFRVYDASQTAYYLYGFGVGFTKISVIPPEPIWEVTSKFSEPGEGGIGNLWIDPSYVDFSDLTTRRKFINADKTWVDLGFYGDFPFNLEELGSSPYVYNTVQNGHGPSDFILGYGLRGAARTWDVIAIGNDPTTGSPYPDMTFDVCTHNALSMDNLFVTIRFHDVHEVFLRNSNDAGASWGNAVGQSLGAIGEFDTSIQWRRQSMGRDRIFEIFWSSPVLTSLIGVFVDSQTET